MMYASKIDVKTDAQVVRYTKNVTIYEPLTIDILEKHIERGQKFDVFREEGGLYADAYHLEIACERLETEKEIADRVARLEAYNRNYEAFNAKYRK